MKKQIKILYTIAIYILSLAHVSAQELVPSKTTYKPGEDIVLTFSDGPGNAKDWVGIYKEGQTPGVVASTLWFYVDGTDGGSTGKATGSLVFKGSLSVGWYEAHLLEGDNYNILASTSFEVSEKTSLPEGVYFEEDFDGLTLGAFESDSESGGDGTDWTAQGPPGWTMGKGEGHGSTAGGEAVKEFDGWTFMDPVSWDATAGQERAQFKKGQGVIAVADSDEYDDKADAKFDAWLSTPEIDITGAGAGTLVLSYDSSWRQEPQTGRVTVSYDGGEEVTLLELGADTATAYDETVELDLKNPAGAKTAVISWDHQGHNNWWWAIDNIMVTGDTGSGVGGPDGLSSILSGLSDEALDSLIAHYDGKHGVKTEGNSVVSWTPINSNGSFLDSMIVRSTQKGGGAPELITYDGSGKLTFDDTNVVADGRYLEGALSNAESKEFTVFWVGNYSADSPFATSGTYVYNIGINSTSHQRDDGKGGFVVEQYNGTTYSGDDITAYDGVSTVWSTVLTADSHAFYANGTNLNVGGTPSNNVKANASIIIGAYSSSGYDFVGDVEQLIIFGSALSDADRELIEDYYGEEKDNAAPVVADQSVDVNEDGSVSITLSGSDEEEDTLSFTVLSQPKNGTLSGTAPSLSYSPNANYSGSDSFSYKANDGSADSNTAIVTITVNGVNDKPEVANQSVDVNEDGSVSITLSGSDEEGDTLSFTVLSQPKNGTLSGTAPALSYSPNANYSGSDSFSYKANDGTADSNAATVTINVIKKEADEPVLSLSKAEYEEGEVIKVSFSGGPGNAKDWLGLYREGELNDDDDILGWLYVDGTEEGNDAKTEGVVSVEVDLAPGSYQVSLFENDGGNILATVGFKVKKTGNNPDLEDNWTILVYGHADHNLGVNLVGDLLEMESVGSGDGLNIVVQTDFNPKAWIRGNKVSSNWLIERHNNISDDIRNQVCRFLIDGNRNNSTFDTQPIEKLPETKNMDNADTLIDFINWGITKYPAKRYGLVLWDHGGQWTGYGGDSQNGTYGDFGFSWDNYGMKTKKIRDAIQTSFTSTGISKFDFVTFDTCLMAGVEVLVDFHDLTDVFMACAEIDYGAGWDYRALDYLKKNPNASTIEFARQEVQYWDKHHSRWGADIELRNHAAFDFNKYNEFNAAFIEFTQRLTTQQSGNIEKITRARRDAIHYWINSVGKMKQPTDYIDLGHFALKLADSLSDGDLKASCLKLAESINSMVIAKSTGNSRKESLGLSVYYPYSGNVSWKYDGLNFFTEEYGGNLWLNQLAQTKNAKISDIIPPLVVVEEGNKTDTGRGKSLDSFNGEQITATYQDPALIKFSIDSSPDAYEAFASVVSNEESDNPNLYIYLGEVANIPLKGSGDYSFSWNGTLPVISQINSEAKAPPIGGSSGVDRLEQKGEFPVYLGGWYMDTNSKTMVSFADYQAYEDGEIIPLIFMTKFDSNGIGSIDTILYDNSDENESWLSPTASNVELEPGGKIWPIYYSEELKDNGEWEVYFTYFEDGYISVPEDGTEGLTISWEPVYDGKYGVELQSFDNLGNGSDITEFEIVVGASGDLPSVSFSTEGGNFVLTWAMGDGGDEAVLQWVEGYGGDWSDVPSGNIDFGGDGRLYKETATAESRFFRLIKR